MSGKGVRPSFEPNQEHIDMWHRVWSCTRLAEIAGVSKDTMFRGMKRIGLDLLGRPRPVIDEIIQECHRLRAEGMGKRDISDIVGYSERHIQRWLNPKVVEQGTES